VCVYAYMFVYVCVCVYVCMCVYTSIARNRVDEILRVFLFHISAFVGRYKGKSARMCARSRARSRKRSRTCVYIFQSLLVSVHM
jgi:hypothetical protein